MTSGSGPQDPSPPPAAALPLSTNHPQPSQAPVGGWGAPAAWPPTQPAAGLGGAPLASWSRRCVASLIDAVIIAFPLVLLGALIGAMVGVPQRGRIGDETIAFALLAFCLGVLLFLALSFLYAPALMARAGRFNGQTWGKEWMGIRAVRDDGRPWTFGSAAIREILVKGLAVSIASSLVPVLPWFLNYLWPLFDERNRALHDIAVSSHVVRE